jgi:uncharacterized protein YbjT (DUF2867 family)
MKEVDMKVFVTGSTGLLGNNLIRALEAAGYTVAGLVRSEEKGRRLLGDTRATLVTGDMRDVPAFASALDGCEVAELTAMMDAGKLIHTIGARFPLTRIASAHEAVESGKVMGNVVVDID